MNERDELAALRRLADLEARAGTPQVAQASAPQETMGPPIPPSTGPGVGLTDFAVQGASLGFGDEVGAAGAGTGGVLKNIANSLAQGEVPSLSAMGDAFSGSYNRRLGERRRDMAEYREKNPIASTAAELVGGLALGGRTGPRAPSPPVSTARQAANAAATGAGLGSGYGAGTAEGGPENRLAGAATGAAVGGLTGGVLGGATGALANRAARKTIPTTDELRTAADTLYKQADQAGVQINPQAYDDFANDVLVTLKDAAYRKGLHPKVASAVEAIEEGRGQAPTLKDMDLLRRIVGIAGKSKEPDEMRVSGILTDKLDDFLTGLTNKDVLSGDPAAGVQALEGARGLWSRMRKGEMIENMMDRAGVKAKAQYTGSGNEGTLRQEFKQLALNDKKMRGFSDEEQAAIRKVAEGGNVQNFLRLVGKGAIRGSLSALPALGASFINPAVGVGLAATGEAGRRISTAMGVRNANLAAELMRAGGQMPQQAVPNSIQALVRALAMGGTQQGVEQSGEPRLALARALSGIQ